jgi:hypothetical protein
MSPGHRSSPRCRISRWLSRSRFCRQRMVGARQSISDGMYRRYASHQRALSHKAAHDRLEFCPFSAPLGIKAPDHRILRAFFDRELKSHKWRVAPVQQARGRPLMSHHSQTIQRILVDGRVGRVRVATSKVTDHLLLDLRGISDVAVLLSDVSLKRWLELQLFF